MRGMAQQRTIQVPLPITVLSGDFSREPTWTNNGKFGKALSFDASTPANGDVVNLTDNTAYQVTTGLTLSAWVNPSIKDKQNG